MRGGGAIELRERCRQTQGYALLDVLLAMFMFGLGFATLYGLSEAAWHDSQQAVNLNEAANLAQSTLDRLSTRSWAQNFADGSIVVGETVEGDDGRYHWRLHSAWDALPDLLQVSIRVEWPERGQRRQFQLDTIYHVH